ncbi:unnamed protein product [Diatraea saccharalis]|uniref:Uncharacterized protein n=1 Tax=Diatraea saccharalis TaxID=40085 RepID=A0A9N9RCU2_9NEOP|nr:unnamed protein product [Diatraea saccharalis]
MEGILSIDINVMKEGGMRARESPEEREESEPVTKRKRISNMTAPPVLECIYQYPDQKQMETILSNMMNELTKVQNRSHDHNIKHKLEQFLRDEILRARGDQLVMLCDYFQICYGDLL